MSASEQHRSWHLTVRVKSKDLVDLRLSVSNFPLSHCGSSGESISFTLRLRRIFLLRVKSENRIPGNRAAAARAKPLQFLKNIFRPRKWFSRKKNEYSKKRSSEASLTNSYQLRAQGLLASSHLASVTDRGEVLMHAFAFVLCLVLIIGICKTIDLLHLFVYLVVGICFALCGMRYANLLPVAAVKVWSSVTGTGCQLAFSRVISWTKLYIRRKWPLAIVLYVFPVMLLCKETDFIHDKIN